ncbi:DBH-like monooxygenase protein 1 [Desmophyllum pertusum]|uniref:DBH-like monooxygenase protein 1 n=1 Tax=Desmophyllum pertusum TaxID=174260 RepID=A0A9W9Z9B5_9CNID|nr:DBH-like monooxygenase protein 1 [Desmophyllum pertusum]
MRDTGDTSQDVVIKTGPMYLIWAYHSTDDVDPNSGSFSKHSQRGAVPYTFIEYTMVKINENYRLYWKYDKASDMFYFTVVVKTTGWVAFAVSNQRGGMKGYDAMIGGVRSGVGYIGDYSR